MLTNPTVKNLIYIDYKFEIKAVILLNLLSKLKLASEELNMQKCYELSTNLLSKLKLCKKMFNVKIIRRKLRPQFKKYK